MSDDRQPGGDLPDELRELSQRLSEQEGKDAELADLREQLTALEDKASEAEQRAEAAEQRATAAEAATIVAEQRVETVMTEVRRMLGKDEPSEAPGSTQAAAEKAPEAKPDDTLLPEHRKRQVIIEAIFQERFGMEPSEFRSRTRGTGRTDARDIAVLIHRYADTSHAEIASMLDTSQAASHTRASKAGQRLEKELPFGEEYDQTKKLVDQLMDPEQQVRMNMARVAPEVRSIYTEAYGVSQEEYALTRRRAGRTNARRAMAYTLAEAGVTLSGIASQLDRSEDAVRTMIRRARNQLTEDPKFLREVTRIRIRAAELVVPAGDSPDVEIGEDAPDDGRLPEQEEAELSRLEEQYNSRVADTLREVLSEFEVTLEDVQGSERDGALVKARSAIFSILLEVEQLPPEDIMKLIEKNDAELMFRLADERQSSRRPEWMDFNETVEEIKERIIAKHGFGVQRTLSAAEIPAVTPKLATEADDEEEIPLSEAVSVTPPPEERTDERRGTDRPKITAEYVSQLRSQDHEAILTFREQQDGHIQRLMSEAGIPDNLKDRVMDSVASRLSMLPEDVGSIDYWVRGQAEMAFMRLAEQVRPVTPEEYYAGMKHRYDNVAKTAKLERADSNRLKEFHATVRQTVAELVRSGEITVASRHQQRELMQETGQWMYKLERVLVHFGCKDAPDVSKPLHQMPEDFQRGVIKIAAEKQLERLKPKRDLLQKRS